MRPTWTLSAFANDFEPLSRDRFLAGALLPAAWVQRAQRVRHAFARRVAEAFAHVGVLLAPATPCVAPVVGTEWLEINGQRLPARASLGVLTQPVSCIGLRVCTVPIWDCHPSDFVAAQQATRVDDGSASPTRASAALAWPALLPGTKTV